MKNLKQILVVAVFIMCVLPVEAQIKSGPIVTVSSSWMEKSEMNDNSYGSQYGEKAGTWKGQVSFQLGYQFLFPLKNKFTVSTALLYQSRGMHVAYDRSFDNKVDENKRFNALAINGILNYYIIGKIPVGIGLEPTYYLNTKMEDNLQKKSTFDVPVILKVGYDLGIVEVSLSYKHGFRSLYWNSLYRKTASRDIQLSIFVPLFR